MLSAVSVVTLLFGAASFLQANFSQERYEARLRANRIPHGVDFQFWQPGSVFVDRPFEPVQRFRVIAGEGIVQGNL